MGYRLTPEGIEIIPPAKITVIGRNLTGEVEDKIVYSITDIGDRVRVKEKVDLIGGEPVKSLGLGSLLAPIEHELSPGKTIQLEGSDGFLGVVIEREADVAPSSIRTTIPRVKKPR